MYKHVDACILLFLGCISHHDAAYQMKTSLFVWGSVITYHYDDDPHHHHHHHHHHDDDHDHDHDGVDPSSSFFHSSLCCFAACYVALGTWCGSCFTHYSCFPHMIGRSFGGVLVFPAWPCGIEGIYRLASLSPANWWFTGIILDPPNFRFWFVFDKKPQKLDGLK